ncbi:MAG: alpha-glucosidase [Devosia sp.]|uniref:glycoside hydrolase family 13 protein n=1 Tax=Devosia sp. 66-22 TaxID=1895753 RepID=UPI000927C375|nr:alpha-glucosidase [Devosia sp. 66-22]MBN9345522.1 alpha-glucosidase [Devosia sp.]OJX52570.1 MAG: glucohydrolase [Devosia sp. 66-22]
MTQTSRHWWQSATVYQIYPRSFADSNGDGIGDIPGIIGKLDYLRDLGIGVIWLSPICASPMRDNGYDIADYQAIAPMFGTLEDFDRLVAEAKVRGIGILLDLVVNHTSDQHRWFLDARSSRDSRYRDYYVWRDPAPDGGLPNDIQSTFGGPAWTLDPATGQYWFHQFAPEQPDLNWANPELRADIYRMMNWWLERGIAGFRMDVINLIAKEPDRGITADGPKLHDYIQEMHRETLAGRDVMTVGESWSATPATALLYSGRDRAELSMVFQFEQVMQQWHETWGKWQPKPFDLVALKRVIGRWQTALADDGWNSLFWGNHDLPRAVSKYGDDKRYRVESAKMLATVLHLLKGTPYVYQGEEIGMTNVPFSSIEQYRDIETLNMHRLHLEAGLPETDFITGANENGRDNSRTPMQWNDAAHAGFTAGTPWIEANPNYERINVAAAKADPESILTHYRRLIALRRTLPLVIDGRYTPWLEAHPEVFAYTRTLDTQSLLVIANFTARDVTIDIPAALRGDWQPLLDAAPALLRERATLAPFEVITGLADRSFQF